MYCKDTINSIFIKKIMYDKGYDQKYIVRETGINRSTVSLFLQKKRLPRPKNIKKIADALGVKV